MFYRLIKFILNSRTPRDVLTTLLGSLGVAITGLFFTVMVARVLSPDRFGFFSALMALAILFASFGDAGIAATIFNFLPKFKKRRSIVISVTFWSQLLVGLALTAFIIFLIPFRSYIIPYSTAFQLILTALVTFVFVFNGFGKKILIAERNFVFYSILQTLDPLIKLLLTLILLFGRQLNIENLIWITLISALVTTVVGLRKEIKNIAMIFPKNHFKKFFAFSKWTALIGVFDIVATRIDVVLLVALNSAYQAGIFSAAARITILFVLLVGNLNSVVIPRFSHFKRISQVKKYTRKLTLMVTVIAIGLSSMAFFAPLVINLIFGPVYKEAIPVFRLLTFSMLPLIFGVVTVNPLIYFFNRPDFVAKTVFLQIAVLVVIDVLLIPRFGAIAPAISLTIANLLLLAFTGYKLRVLLH